MNTFTTVSIYITCSIHCCDVLCLIFFYSFLVNHVCCLAFENLWCMKKPFRVLSAVVCTIFSLIVWCLLKYPHVHVPMLPLFYWALAVVLLY